MTTARTITDALRRRYGSGNATVIAFEVAAGTGAHARRHMDAVVMELWPSRGLTLHAIEIKVSKSDLKRELLDGQKAEEIAQYCDFMSIAAPLGIVKPAELPSTWGLIEVDKADNVRISKEPRKTKARAVDRGFMAAMIRASARPAQARYNEAVARLIEEDRRKLNDEVERRVKERMPDAEMWRGLQAELRKHGVAWMWGPDVQNAVAFVLRSGALNAQNGIVKMEGVLRHAADMIKLAVEPLQSNVVEIKRKK